MTRQKFACKCKNTMFLYINFDNYVKYCIKVCKIIEMINMVFLVETFCINIIQKEHIWLKFTIPLIVKHVFKSHIVFK